MKNKKGLSAIVASLLIILITIAAVFIVWQVVKKNIQTSGEQTEQTQCFSVNLAIDKCVKSATDGKVTLSYTSGSVSKVVITLENGAAINTTTITGTSLPVIGGKQVYTINLANPTKASVSAFVTSTGGTELGCPTVADEKVCS